MSFPSLRIEGAILSADILGKLESGELPGQRPTDFGYASPSEFRDELARAWTDALAFWRAFQRVLDNPKCSATATSETRNQFLVPLLGLLGYRELEFSRSEVVGDKSFPISFRLRSHDGFPVHVIGARESLDKKPTVSAGPRSSPHALAQEYLNLTEHLYAVVTNGRLLRLLRDSTRLVKLSYVEFDLDRIFAEELFADFAVLYRLLHVSRLPKSRATASESLLERYHQDALESGARIRDGLSFAVEQVLQELGTGFLARNPHLQAAVETNTLTAREFYQALLRLIYRLLFLMAAEERGLIHRRETNARLRKIYFDYYSIDRLRRLAEQRQLVSSARIDLWVGLRGTFRLFETEGTGAPLELTALAGQLFSSNALGPLATAEIDNGTLLTALRKLSLFRQPDTGQITRVNYASLASEEFGSVYERLLELHPVIHKGPPIQFSFKSAAGNERKTTGSYYTPSSLVECLLNSALNPVLEERISHWRKLGYASVDEAVLSIRVCDPACGSGHFLIAAGQRIARRLASIRAGDEEPSPEQIRTAIRQVIGRCLCGVDINPMAVELCKVTLWLEALDPGKPLSFLDHHIRVGNSLLGATPELVAAGIPDDAFKGLEGDDKRACAILKKLNARERLGFGELFSLEDRATRERLQQAAAAVEHLPDDSVRDIGQKSAAFEQLQRNHDFERATDLANLWCAAFVIRKRMADGEISSLPTTQPLSSQAHSSEVQTGLFGESFPEFGRQPKSSASTSPQPSNLAEAIGITSGRLRDFAKGATLPSGLKDELRELVIQFRFFNWHIAFPEVFRGGGFDVVIGNPPWEELRPEEKSFFSVIAPDIARIENRAQRRSAIAALEERAPELWVRWVSHCREILAAAHLLHSCGRYPDSAVGNLNTHTLFFDLFRQLLAPNGRAGIIVPSGVATNEGTSSLFGGVIRAGLLRSFFDFENRRGYFPEVDSRARFSLATLGKPFTTDESPRFGFFLIDLAELTDPDRVFALTSDDLSAVNPNTLTCPTFRSRRSAELVKTIHKRNAIIMPQGTAGDWKASSSRMFDMSYESDQFSVEASDKSVPLYEGKMVAQFNHRASSVLINRENAARQAQGELSDLSKLKDPNFSPKPQYWVQSHLVDDKIDPKWRFAWLLNFCGVTSPTNERTCTAVVTPRVAAGNSLLQVYSEKSAVEVCCLLGNLNSFPLDFVLREKMGGINLNHFIFRQLPVVACATYTNLCAWAGGSQIIRDWLLPRVLELTYTAWDLQAFAEDCGWFGPPFKWDEDRRFQLRCELDAAFFHLYGLNRDDTSYVLDTFPIVKRKDEEKFGTYRTKYRILELYDALVEAQRTGKQFISSLNPPPADPRCCHPPREGTVIPMAIVPAPIAALTPPTAPVWADQPLVYPASPRFPLGDKYRTVAVYELLHQGGGAVSFERFRRAYWLLTEPTRLEAQAAQHFTPALAKQWKGSFAEKLSAVNFVPYLSDASKAGELELFREKSVLMIRTLKAPSYTPDHVIFDARLALSVADLWPDPPDFPKLTAEDSRALEKIQR